MEPDESQIELCMVHAHSGYYSTYMVYGITMITMCLLLYSLWQTKMSMFLYGRETRKENDQQKLAKSL